jgi:hypothetical protein
MSGADSPGLLARLRAWLGSLFGGNEASTTEERGTTETTERAEAGRSGAETDETTAEPTPATHVCTVCGTDVADPAGGCPLCGSTDVRERGATSEESSPGPSPAATATESTVDGEASRLRELRDGPPDEGASEDASEAE